MESQQGELGDLDSITDCDKYKSHFNRTRNFWLKKDANLGYVTFDGKARSRKLPIKTGMIIKEIILEKLDGENTASQNKKEAACDSITKNDNTSATRRNHDAEAEKNSANCHFVTNQADCDLDTISHHARSKEKPSGADSDATDSQIPDPTVPHDIDKRYTAELKQSGHTETIGDDLLPTDEKPTFRANPLSTSGTDDGPTGFTSSHTLSFNQFSFRKKKGMSYYYTIDELRNETRKESDVKKEVTDYDNKSVDDEGKPATTEEGNDEADAVGHDGEPHTTSSPSPSTNQSPAQPAVRPTDPGIPPVPPSRHNDASNLTKRSSPPGERRAERGGVQMRIKNKNNNNRRKRNGVMSARDMPLPPVPEEKIRPSSVPSHMYLFSDGKRYSRGLMCVHSLDLHKLEKNDINDIEKKRGSARDQPLPPIPGSLDFVDGPYKESAVADEGTKAVAHHYEEPSNEPPMDKLIESLMGLTIVTEDGKQMRIVDIKSANKGLTVESVTSDTEEHPAVFSEKEESAGVTIRETAGVEMRRNSGRRSVVRNSMDRTDATCPECAICKNVVPHQCRPSSVALSSAPDLDSVARSDSPAGDQQLSSEEDEPSPSAPGVASEQEPGAEAQLPEPAAAQLVSLHTELKAGVAGSEDGGTGKLSLPSDLNRDSPVSIEKEERLANPPARVAVENIATNSSDLAERPRTTQTYSLEGDRIPCRRVSKGSRSGRSNACTVDATISSRSSYRDDRNHHSNRTGSSYHSNGYSGQSSRTEYTYNHHYQSSFSPMYNTHYDNRSYNNFVFNINIIVPGGKQDQCPKSGAVMTPP